MSAPAAMVPAATGLARIGPEEIGILADFSHAFAASLDVGETLRRAVAQIAEHMNAEAAAVFLVDSAAGDIECRACAGPVDVVGMRVQQGRGIVGRAIAENRVQLVRDTSLDPDFLGNRNGFNTRSILCAPLHTADGAIGALQVLNKRDGQLFDSHDADVLRLLAVPTALALNNARLTRELVEQNRIKREFQLARQMQKTLLPARRKDFPMTALNLPAREISGDFYDYFELPDGRIAFCLGDVAGKGMDAALLMVRASSCLRWAGKDGTPPGEWLARVNRELCETVTRGMFVCAVAGYYDPRTSMLELSNAGFPPLLLRRTDESIRELRADGPPLGILSDYVYENLRLALAGGSLYCFSDGVTDVRGPERRPIGIEGVRALIERVSGLSPRARVRAMVGHLRKLSLADDTTLMLIADDNAQPRYLGGIAGSSDPENLRLVRRKTSEVLNEIGFDEDQRARLVLAVDEAVANVIRHAYAGCCDGRVELSFWLDADALRIELRDYADPVDPNRIKPRDLSECRPGGLGVNLIDSVMDAWGFRHPEDGPGNQLTMIKRLP
ncbi:MAG: SpoIIE family protein phosphatase [Rhodanobacteraceae bacterium]|nr:SpoIIE family protein phosphatase [Rhodanobacteraceae bacterium]